MGSAKPSFSFIIGFICQGRLVGEFTTRTTEPHYFCQMFSYSSQITALLQDNIPSEIYLPICLAKKPACQTLSELIMEPLLYRCPFLLPPPILPQFRFFGPKNVTPSAADPSRASSLSFPVRPLSELHCQTKTSRNRLRG